MGLVLAIAGAMGMYYEGTRHTAYQDSVGVLTICQGHTKGVHAGDTATDKQCEAYLKSDMAEAYSYVNRCIDATVSIKTAAAFTDAAYNLGPAVVCGSTLQRKANAGDIRGACNELPRWIYAGGKKLKGLVKRRASERELCLEGLQ